jgi:hypothetical protein
MKASHVCPKCHSGDILQIPGQAIDGFGHDYIVVSKWTNLERIPMTRYVCASCGYSEQWVESEGDLARLIERYR